MKFVSKIRQRGVTLFELLLVLFVAAFVAVAVATIYNKVNTTYKTNSLFNATNQLAANTRALFGGSGGVYTVLTPQNAISAGIVPDVMHNGATEVHPFYSATGAWTMGIVSGGAQFTITLNNLPQGVCVDVASRALGVAQAVAVGATAITSVAGAITNCAPGTADSLTLTYS